MPWVLAVFLAVAAVWTVAASRFTRMQRWSLPWPELTDDDPVVRWLFRHHGLTSLHDCYAVRNAVRRGHAVDDPALRGTAHGLAAELLSGRLRDPNPAMLLPAVLYALVGCLWLGTGLALGGRDPYDIWVGAVWLLGACAWAWRAAKLPRRTVKRALRLNKDEMGTPASG